VSGSSKEEIVLQLCIIGGASNTVTLHILNLREIGGFFFSATSNPRKSVN
jgi:hypothetical protein